MKCLLRTLILFTLCCPLPVLADKSDIVILKNGDRITGEIKRLQARLLQFSTDAMGTINIEWRHIERVISTENQSVETTDGHRYLGHLTSLDDSDAIGVQTNTQLIELDADEVFSAWPVKATFADRSDFDISVGFDYQKSTDIVDLTLAADWEHRRENRLTQANLRTNITQQEGSEDQRRTNFNFSHQYIHDNRRFNSWLGSMETNESLGLDLRLLAGGVYGTYLLRKTDHWLSLSGGLVGTQEKYARSDTTQSLEAVIDTQFRWYRYADPERSLSTRLTLFPSLTESGRYRSDFRTTFKLEFLKDVYWSMDLYYQYDSNPPANGIISTIKEDYGITTSFGWSP